MVKYLAQFIPNESDITAPLKQDVDWSCMPEHDEAIGKLKKILMSQPVLQFYDVTKPVKIQADASQKGLGACLIQDNKPVAYLSRALTSAEVNYAQLEKELLAICFTCDKFHQFIYGKEVDIESDHKLQIILKKPVTKASPRVERMMLRLQRYDINVKYLPGNQMFLADTLSRAYIKGVPDRELENDIEVMVHALVRDLPATPTKIKMVRESTESDETLQ